MNACKVNMSVNETEGTSVYMCVKKVTINACYSVTAALNTNWFGILSAIRSMKMCHLVSHIHSLACRMTASNK